MSVKTLTNGLREYHGETKNNQPHGSGMMIDRSKVPIMCFQGNFQNGLMHGKGTLSFIEGDAVVGTIQGNWKNNEYDGVMTATHKNGETMTLEFKEGKEVNRT